jgi:hypothetical protein
MIYLIRLPIRIQAVAESGSGPRFFMAKAQRKKIYDQTVFYVLLNSHKGHPGSKRSLQSNRGLFTFAIPFFAFLRTILGCLNQNPDPLILLNPDPKH